MTTLEHVRQQKIDNLKAEIEAIDVANREFWRLDPYEQLRDAKSEYERRRKRLEEIRLELLML